MKDNPIDFIAMHQLSGDTGCNYYCDIAKGTHAYVMYSNVPYSSVDAKEIQAEYEDFGVPDIEVVSILPCREPGPFNPLVYIGNLQAKNPIIVLLKEKEL